MDGQWYVVAWSAVVGLLAFVAADAPVRPAQLAAFARRHALTLTPASAVHVARYLAVTRRWRVAGVATSATWYVVNGLRHQSISFSLSTAIAGWFVGAVVAEALVSAPSSLRRVARLTARSQRGYLSPAARPALWAALALAVFAGVLPWAVRAGVPVVDRAWSALDGVEVRFFAAPLITAAVLSAVVAWVGRRVVLRPQATDAPDLVAADEALRANSLQVLYAAAVTLLLFAATGPLLVVVAPAEPSTVLAFIAASAVGIVALGLLLARATPRSGAAAAGVGARAQSV